MSRLFGGVGIYTDTIFRNVRWPMLHLDRRPTPYTVIWARHEGDYIYPSTSAQALRIFTDALEIAADLINQNVRGNR